MRIRPILYMAGLLALAGCSEMEEALTGKTPIALTQSAVTAEMRAAQDLNEGNIGNGEDITVKITDNTSSATTDYVYTAGTSGALTPKSGTPYYPATGSVNIDAWYPAGVTATFSVQADQTADADYKKSDLMYASADGKTKTSGTVNLAFTHKMAKLNVNVTAGDGITDITSVTLKDVQRQASVDLLTGTVTTDAEHPVSDITISNYGAVVFPAQTLDGELLSIVTPEGTATYAIASKAFEAGNQYTLSITLNNTAVGTTSYINGWEGSGNATVNPAANDQLAIGDISGDPFTYTGSAITPTPTVSYNGSTLTRDTDYELTYRDNINAGTATVIAIGKGTHAGKAAAKTFEISKASAVVTAPTAKSLTYNASAQALVNAGSTTGGELQYSLDDATYSKTVPTATNAGSYTVYYKVVGDDNYENVAATSINVSIAKAENPFTVSLASYSIRTTTTTTASTSGVKESATITFASNNTSVATVSGSTVTGVAAGVTTIKATSAETANYKATTKTSSNLTVYTRAAGDIVLDGTNIKVYTSSTGGYKVSCSNTSNGTTWSNNSSWGSKDQWTAIFSACGGTTYTALNTKAKAAVGSAWTDMSGLYWSCTEYDSNNAWDFYGGGWDYYGIKANHEYNVRTVSAFND